MGKVIRSHASAGSIKVGGAGRTNATPNLNDGNVFIGNASNQSIARALTASDIQSGTFADARIAESNVTQHEAALSITESQISDLQSYLTSVALNDVSDVTITSASSGQVLKYNGSVWINDTDAGGIEYTDLSVTTNPAGTAALSYNNANGVFTYTPPDLSSYLTSYTETDPVFNASAASGITSTNITNWNTAYGWGDHASAGYLTSFTETDPTVPSHVKSITTTEKSNWNTAYSWGNHASAGYLTSFNITTQTDPKYLRSDTEDTSSGSLIIAEDWGSGTYNSAFVIQGTYPSWETRGNATQDKGWLHHQDSSGNYTLYSIASYTGNSWTQRFTFNHADQTFRNGGPSGNIYWHAGNDGSGSGLDADTVDGIQGSSFLRSDAADTATGNLTFTGSVLSNGYSSGDNWLPFTDGNFYFRADCIFDNTVDFNSTFSAQNATFDAGTSTTIEVKCDDGGLALVRATGDNQGTGAFEVGQSTTYGGGFSYNGDGSPGWVSGETADHITFYRVDNGTRTEVFHYPYNSNVVNFNSTPTVGGSAIWHAGNDGSGSGLDADTLDGSGWLDYGRDIHANQVIADDWLRTTGQTGWYSNTYGGGWYMTDTTWIRSYNSKSIYQNAGTLRTDGTLQVGGSGATLNAPNGGTVTISGNTAWHAGNDGSGSGLDADTVDGIQGSSLMRLDATQTIPDGVRHIYECYGNIATSSGSQSSLEIFNNGAGTDAFLTFHVGGDFAAYFGLDGGTNDLAYGGWSAGAASYKVWHAANDGSGSGLDADTLDGYQGSNYIGLNGNSYFQLTTWLQSTSTHGLYFPSSGAGTHFYPGSLGDYGSFRVDGRKSGWGGISLEGRVVFMHNGANESGIYNDVANHWLFYAINGDKTAMYHNGSEKIYTYASGGRVTGDFLATGDIYAYYSDERLKDKTGKIENALDKVDAIETFYYTHNDKANELGYDGKDQQVGVSAQSVAEVMPEVVHLAPIDDDGQGNSISGENYQTVNYARLVPLLIESIKELRAEVKDLKEQLK
jgi:hypothetical protein